MNFYKRLRFWVFLLVIAVVVIISVKSRKAVDVKGYQVSRKDLVIGVTATSTGTIKSDRELKLTAQRVGRIIRLPVEEGTEVEKGALIAEFDSEEALQRQHVAAANVERLRAGLEALRLAYGSYKAEIDSNISKARSFVTETEARFRRLSELRDKGYLADIDVDAVRKEVEVARAGYTSALASREMIKSRDEEIKAQSAALRQAEGEYALSRINYDYSFVRTSMPGYVTARPVKLGETVITGSLVASVVSWDSLYIESFIDEADVAKIRIGQAVNVTMDAYQGKVFRGEVYMISPVVLGGKLEARTFEVRVRLLDRDVVVKPGMSADVEVITDTIKNVVLVPSQAVIERSENKSVFISRNGKALKKTVKTGPYNWSYVSITEGIEEGDIVILNPDDSGLTEGARVRVIKTDK
ncbi:MAG: efflux RND transporter periplasmic adaptor subunit [Nitrospirae bacterium]|nr:efflux RND transporter periplasmic adaptor subunit [Nitrospirota bacterium]